MADPERFLCAKRNVILNRCLMDLGEIIQGHDPDIHHLEKSRVWDRLDEMALEIERLSETL